MVSVYSCDVHHGRIRGALEGLRVTCLSGESRYSRRLRVCPNDLDEILRGLLAEWSLATDDGAGLVENLLCSSCGKAFGTPGRRFCVAYVWRRGQPQSEYCTDLCEACSIDLIDTWNLKEENIT